MAKNVQQWGTGAINVDGCRVQTDEHLGGGTCKLWSHYRDGTEPSSQRRYGEHGGTDFQATPGPRGGSPDGRWPANLIHDGSEEVVGLFPVTKSPTQPHSYIRSTENTKYGKDLRPIGSQVEFDNYGDSGSAARFFYCAKASRSERGKNNSHPTVKPLALMRYLVRLVTPPYGTVLDPFTGSGTTLIAAQLEGFHAIGIDQNPDYAAIATQRIAEHQPEKLLF